jgi:hypothetical protein
MKKPKLSREVKERLEALAASQVVGADIKAALEHIMYMEVYFLAQLKLLDWACERASITAKEKREKINQIERDIMEYEDQAQKFMSRSLRGEFGDYPDQKPERKT